ncbi:TBCC-domain-containing protein [Lophiostoma macrostomum CBS 122681]|uniref:TBCC-domain-containing protein n=1 Tax=Lophiostoma macrostomum CBS 122681 TaxID=1314788 RepID=A0A6A6TEY0_9PLEO|nr:TBCC-domain-containing protein [Lophiostoma macrostomum CBS 122681]
MATSAQSNMQLGTKERFFAYFKHEVTALQEQMERLATTAPSGGERKDAVDHCLAGIDRLSHEVKDASSYIPAYDQRTYADAIKALGEKLQKTRNDFAPPKKFQFSTARKNASAISINDAAELAQQHGSGSLHVPGYPSDASGTNSSFAPTPLDKLSPSEEKPEPDLHARVNKNLSRAREDEYGGEGGEDGNAASSSAIRKPSFSNASSITISNHTSVHILLPTSASHATSSGTVSNVRHSVVDLSPPTTSTTTNSTGASAPSPFAGLTLKNIKDSLIICGAVAGSAHVTSVENSVVVVATCRQFRMHSSKNVDVYLHCASRPIIEDCEGVRFAEVPGAYTTSDSKQTPNQWDKIDDFTWLKAGPNPHYKLLDQADRISDEVWTQTVPGGHSVSLDDILRAVGVLR